ncbi:Uncharacterised protein [Salmonella enterica subsp. enterica]|uniref:Uncharacterized protein n=1 Tax=Salmonella enterica I TaxID=59201 RepID=A0A447TTZ4_SALET|nr:Uncharacterised protein [Salmonella enterica subsp. enterica]
MNLSRGKTMAIRKRFIAGREMSGLSGAGYNGDVA